MIAFSPLFIDSNFLLLLKIFNKYKLKHNEIITYSVRTSIHTFLTLKNYKPKSKILISSINITSIIDIIKEHNLEYIGVDLDFGTLDFNKDDFITKIKNNNICCCIYSHLFGKINDINYVIDICNKNNIDFIEDCAECFTPNYNGNCRSDIISFSFGSIKKCTCFGGSKTIIKNDEDFKKFKTIINKYKKQSNYSYILKLFKYFYISLILNNKFINLIIRKICYFFNININNILVKLITNINSTDLINNITYQPCFLLRKYLLSRINNYKICTNYNETYVEKNLKINYLIPGIYCNRLKNYWLFPIYCNKYNLLKNINSNDINYVKKISQLVCIDKTCKNSLDFINNVYFFPIHSLTSLKNTKYIVNKLNNLNNESDNYFCIL